MKPLDTHPCPHCSARSIGAWRKVNSSPFKPAICCACGNASYAAGPCSAISMITMQLLFLSSLFLAVLLGSPYWLSAFPMGLVAMTFALGRIFPLVAAGASVREIRRKAVRRAWYVAGGGALVLTLLSLLYSPPALPRTTLFTSLGAELRRADAVFVARVQGGECVEPECAESAPHLTRYRYSLRCLEALLGKCDDRAPLVSSSRLKLGQDYAFIVRKEGEGRRVFPIEMMGHPAPDAKLLYDGSYHADGVSVHDDPDQLNSRLIYFTYADFRRALRSARAPASAP